MGTNEIIHFVLTIVGSILAGMFALASWLVRLWIRRLYVRFDEFKKHEQEQDERLDWTRTILAMAGLIPQPVDPDRR